MPESPYVKDSEYTVNPSSYESNRGQYLVNSLDYISSIDTYSIINDVTQYGELFSTSTVPHGEYELTIDTYVYEPPISRYPSWTFGDAIWAVLKVAGIVLGCVTFVYLALNGTLIALLKTVPYALMDLAEMGFDFITGSAPFIFPRLQALWPNAYDAVVSFFTSGKHSGCIPYFGFVEEAGSIKRKLLWMELYKECSEVASEVASEVSSLPGALWDAGSALPQGKW